MSSFKTKAQIRNALTRRKEISLDSTNMVNGVVTFSVDRWSRSGPWMVRCIGFANTVEREISDIDDLVSYLYRERKRICDVT